MKCIGNRLSTEEITAKIERNNPAIIVKKVKRIAFKSKVPTTVVIITSKGYDIPAMVNIDKRMQQTENFIPKSCSALNV